MNQHDPNQENRQGTGWLRLILFATATVCAVWVAGSPCCFSTWRGMPNTPLTTLLYLTGAAIGNRGVCARYQWSIVAGLGCSSVGDVFLMQSRDYFVAGLGSFLAAHLCYLWAFTSDSRLGGRKLPFVVWGVFGMVLVSSLWPGVPRALRVPVTLYAIALLAMAAQAAGRAASKRDVAASLAAAGAGLFVISDSVLAFQRFRYPLEWGHVAVLGTYFAAQAGIALSAALPPGRAP